MDFNERVIPGESANFLYQEALTRYEFAQKFLKKGGKVLDLGCGTGYGSAILGQMAKVTGLDQNQEAIEFAQKKYGSDAKFMVGDITHLQTPGHEFNLVCCFEVIEHLKNPEKMLREVKRVLKPDGYFLLSTPNQDVLSIKGELTSPYHVKEYDLKEIEELLGQFFSRVEMFGQRKSVKAKKAYALFLDSQKSRQSIVNLDKFRIRKYFPKALKEKTWKYLGSFFGRQPQEELTTEDFPINKTEVFKGEYLLSVCRP